MTVKKEEMLECWREMLLFLANHGWTEIDPRAVAIEALISRQGNQLRVTNHELVKELQEFEKRPDLLWSRTLLFTEYMLKKFGIEVVEER